MVSVLFVDDDAFVLSTYQRIMRGQNYQCFYLQQPELLSDQLYIPQLSIILSDQKMPRCGGIELLLQMQQQFPQIKRVLLSGDSAMAATAVQAGLKLDAFLAKPCSKATLLHCIEALI
jgi:DNA-binding NtrC family response regulator